MHTRIDRLILIAAWLKTDKCMRSPTSDKAGGQSVSLPSSAHSSEPLVLLLAALLPWALLSYRHWSFDIVKAGFLHNDYGILTLWFLHNEGSSYPEMMRHRAHWRYGYLRNYPVNFGNGNHEKRGVYHPHSTQITCHVHSHWKIPYTYAVKPEPYQRMCSTAVVRSWFYHHFQDRITERWHTQQSANDGSTKSTLSGSIVTLSLREPPYSSASSGPSFLTFSRLVVRTLHKHISIVTCRSGQKVNKWFNGCCIVTLV